MKVAGAHTVPVGRQQLWDALHDPELLRRALPGCSRLDCTEPGRYVVTIRVGIPCVEGAYHGDLQVVERTAPSSLTLVASAAGERGSGQGQITVDLDETDDGATRVSYDVDAEVAGAISRVGQRLLTSAVERTVADHLDAVAGAHGHGTHRGDGVTPAARTMVEASPGGGADRAHTDPGGAVELASGQDSEQDRGFAPLAVTQKQALATAAIGSALIGFLLGRRSRR